jgi:hypothetical protein
MKSSTSRVLIVESMRIASGHQRTFLDVGVTSVPRADIDRRLSHFYSFADIAEFFNDQHELAEAQAASRYSPQCCSSTDHGGGNRQP